MTDQDSTNDTPVDRWELRTTTLHFGRLPALMGIVNVTPDSFSDGGQFVSVSAAVEHAMKLIDQGAEIIDVGGESTRPYSEPVSVDEELKRTVPVIEAICRNTQIPVSIDTSKSVVARECLAAGAEIINDVTGLEGDPGMIDVARDSNAGICAMHMQGTPQTMQDNPTYDDVVTEILQYLLQRKRVLLEQGILANRICFDPGIGFGKTHRHNLELINHCDRFHELRSPILVGHSRKGFLGKILGNPESDRAAATAGSAVQLARKGIQIIRVHDVGIVHETLVAFDAVGGIDGQIHPDFE